MDEHSLKVLEYNRVIERLAAHASTTIGREFVLELMPLPYPETVLRRLQETREARLLRDSEGGLPLGGLHDLRDTLESARIGVRLAGMELVRVRHTVESARRLRMHLLNRAAKTPLLAQMASNLPLLPLLESRIETCLSESGEVKDSASPELGRIRSQQKTMQARLTDRLQSILTSERYKTFIQDGVVTVREGRYCIPVKAEFARAFGGIVHDTSASGATVFMEPVAAVELGNELRQLAVQEEQEVGRIMRELAGLVAGSYDLLQQMLSITGHLDVIHCRALLAEEMSGIEPALNRRGIVRLINARHPLLTGAVTPVSLEMGDRFTTLLITGPNTGGKTVALKTLGLFTLMTLAGMQIPASADSEIALFDQVWADIGDEQDIRQSLSTFSAHMKNIVHILSSASGNSLVLLDEAGAGTDPAEGAALARAILQRLLERGARVIATTHYGELKEYAFSQQGVENASVEFDRETLSPTYRILQGTPGGSNAFYIAARLGLDAGVIEEAKGYLSRRDVETGELLEQIEISHRKTREAEHLARRAREAAEKAQREYEKRLEQIAEVQRTVRQQAQEEARATLGRAAEKAENLLKELQKANKTTRKTMGVRQKLNTLRNETYEALQPAPPQLTEVVEADTEHVYRKGDKVRVLTLNLDGQLLENPREGYATVQMGAMRATLPLAQLRPLRAASYQDTEQKPARRTETSGASQLAMRKAMQISPELMLRALRADEAQSLLDRYLDDAYAAGLQQARIIHGKGTGALRRVVHEFLNGHPMVRTWKLADENEGGDGATLVYFKEA